MQRPPVSHRLRWATNPLPSFPHRLWAAVVSSIFWYACAIHTCPSRKEAKAFLFSRCRAILCPLSTKPNVPCSPEDKPSNLPKSRHSIHGKLDTEVGIHSRMKPTFSDTLSTTTPSQHLHPRTPNPHRFHCDRWRHEQGRSEVINLAVLFGVLDASFPSANGQNPFIRPHAAQT